MRIEGKDVGVGRIEAVGDGRCRSGGEGICAILSIEILGPGVGEAKRSLSALLVTQAIENTASTANDGFKVCMLMQRVGEAEARRKVVLIRFP